MKKNKEMVHMDYFVFYVTYSATITDKVVVDAKTKEEAIKLIKEDSDFVEVLDTVDEERDKILYIN